MANAQVQQARIQQIIDENLDRLATFLERESDLLAPARARLTIGFL